MKKFITFCILCCKEIPLKRQRRRAITCNTKHQKKLTHLRKIERDSRKCHHCGKPMTPDQIRLFREFKRTQDTQGASANRVRGKGIPRAAKGTHAMSEFAYVVETGPKTGKSRRGR